ncbi:MAG TPA: hypothetical protein VLS48_03065, partial [Anaerolineales bacterium]|nr:hypothetical protein [Anaerolineales bacterium]
ELVWRTFPKVEFSLFVDGVEVETLSGFAAPARMLQEVRLGPSTVTATSMTGALYFDNFTATRDLLAFLPLTIR